MAAAVRFADRVNTVSLPAQQIRHLLTVKPWRLAVFISGKLSGIVNGIDTEVYSPVDDKYIAQTFTIDTLEQRRLIKLPCKKLV